MAAEFVIRDVHRYEIVGDGLDEGVGAIHVAHGPFSAGGVHDFALPEKFVVFFTVLFA